MTDPGMSHPEHMLKRTKYLMGKMNKSLYGGKWWKRTNGIEHVIGLERQTRGSMHSHTLIRLPDHDATDPQQFPLKHWGDFANELGGWAKIEIPRDSTETTRYVCKYVIKEGDIHLSKGFNPDLPKSYGSTVLGGTHEH